MTLEYTLRGGLDRLAVGDVALLVLGGLGRAARQTDRLPAARAERASQLGADAGGCAADDRYLQIFNCRPAATVRPPESRSVAVRWWTPFLRPAVFQVTV